MNQHKQVVVDECVSIVEYGYSIINSLEKDISILNDIESSGKYCYLKDRYIASKEKAVSEEELNKIMVSFLKEKGNSIMIPSFFNSDVDINDYEGASNNIIERFRYYITRLLEDKESALQSLGYLENEYRYPFILDGGKRKDILEKIKKQKKLYDEKISTINYLNKIFPDEFYFYQDFLDERDKLVNCIEREGVRVRDLNHLDDYSSYINEQLRENINETLFAALYLKKHFDDNDVIITNEILDRSNKVIELSSTDEDADIDKKGHSAVI